MPRLEMHGNEIQLGQTVKCVYKIQMHQMKQFIENFLQFVTERLLSDFVCLCVCIHVSLLRRLISLRYCQALHDSILLFSCIQHDFDV